MNPNWLWLIIPVGFGILETLALLKRRDKLQPLTYWIRKVFMLKNRKAPLYWIGAGLMGWLAFHFLVDS